MIDSGKIPKISTFKHSKQRKMKEKIIFLFEFPSALNFKSNEGVHHAAHNYLCKFQFLFCIFIESCWIYLKTIFISIHSPTTSWFITHWIVIILWLSHFMWNSNDNWNWTLTELDSLFVGLQHANASMHNGTFCCAVHLCQFNEIIWIHNTFHIIFWSEQHCEDADLYCFCRWNCQFSIMIVLYRNIVFIAWTEIAFEKFKTYAKCDIQQLCCCVRWTAAIEHYGINQILQYSYWGKKLYNTFVMKFFNENFLFLFLHWTVSDSY